MSNSTEFNSNEWIDWIEEAIAKKHIKYYDYKHFNNIQRNWFWRFWKIKEIVNELNLQREVDFHENIIRFCGITTANQDDNSKKYLLVMEYADSGTLRNYLSEHFDSLTWKNKLDLAFQLANAISCLYDEGIVHRDLHSNNILVHKNTIKLADFGFGRPPFHNDPHDVGLAMEIVRGLRENPIPNTPADYIKIYTGTSYNMLLLQILILIYRYVVRLITKIYSGKPL
ncbi:kinase-like domain-containing protein [Rhizophagus irregularis DAOM 181602=DAOM 197198]|nr:kinase-like domain-containing protein [Rhizophagus irregularis DAOM 181602=DAOM 197198]